MVVDALPEDSGSRWRRWEPHIHAPGTIMASQFRGPDVWDEYLKALEAATPVIEALGITDYYCLECYERVLEAKAAGRLSRCGLIFANVETRLNFGTVKGNWTNLHLLVSPEDPEHVTEARRFLANLTYQTPGDIFRCTREELMRLGGLSGAVPNTPAALELGARQFKVTFDQLRTVYLRHEWAQQNILIAVAGGDDGTGGMRDAAEATNRKSVESFAHVIFASSVAQREFWLGKRGVSVDDLKEDYNGLKPCIHGCDAHALGNVGRPDENRYTWVKGDPSFDALHQACIDPESRAYVGDAPPLGTSPSDVIASITLHDAPWAMTPHINLNPGLVAIIGARGSGKTALADVIARACDAGPSPENQQSFLWRAREFLNQNWVTMKWASGDEERRHLAEQVDPESYPRARYLSQQFVEKLCSSYGMTDALLREIERVIFESHSASDRDGAVDFRDLMDLRSRRYRQARQREEEALTDLSDQIGTELEKDKLVATYQSQIRDKEALIRRTETERARLVAKGSHERVEQLHALTSAAETVRGYLRHSNLRVDDLLTMQDEVADRRNNKAPAILREVQRQHAASGIKGDTWKSFLTDYIGDVEGLLAQNLRDATKLVKDRKGTPPAELADNKMSYISQGDDLTRQPLAKLEAEIARLNGLISVDKTTADRYAALSTRLVQENELLTGLRQKLADAQGAKARAAELQALREASYKLVFDYVLNEQNVLRLLYAPIQERLNNASGALNKLSFNVVRTADVAQWAKRGEEELIDLRRQGQFKGSGSLQKIADQGLRKAWETGDGASVTAAMKSFRDSHQNDLLEQARVSKTDLNQYRLWLKQFAKWLYSTDHITISYSVRYDGTDISKLSPGTRGIVLLLLYLALDTAYDRPLIIDQPEENLDPQSIFDELVGLFTEAKSRRQVIMITHNANLVINTDADQIIVANVGPHASDALPPISYLSGGLERADIRTVVCKVLEGGEPAFRERARRLRVRLER
jgi:ABC-type dipeptide/oligopeptide/nickel transport system ATPase component